MWRACCLMWSGNGGQVPQVQVVEKVVEHLDASAWVASPIKYTEASWSISLQWPAITSQVGSNRLFCFRFYDVLCVLLLLVLGIKKTSVWEEVHSEVQPSLHSLSKSFNCILTLTPWHFLARLIQVGNNLVDCSAPGYLRWSLCRAGNFTCSWLNLCGETGRDGTAGTAEKLLCYGNGVSWIEWRQMVPAGFLGLPSHSTPSLSFEHEPWPL